MSIRSSYLLNILFIIYYYNNMSSSETTELTDTAYDILKVLGKDADFLYDTIETYIRDAQKANKSKLVEIWQTIKIDKKGQMHILKKVLGKELHGKKKMIEKGTCICLKKL